MPKRMTRSDLVSLLESKCRANPIAGIKYQPEELYLYIGEETYAWSTDALQDFLEKEYPDIGCINERLDAYLESISRESCQEKGD